MAVKRTLETSLADMEIASDVLNMIDRREISERMIMPVGYDPMTHILRVVTTRYTETFKNQNFIVSNINELYPDVVGLDIYETSYDDFSYGYLRHYQGMFSSVDDMPVEEKSDKNNENNEEVTSELTRLAQDIIMYGIKENASDIHIMPEKEKAYVKYRVDGKLRLGPFHPLSVSDEIMISNYLKRLCKLEVSNLVGQDGRFSMYGRDFRLSSEPAMDSSLGRSSIVLRIIGATGDVPKLDDLGFGEDEIAAIRKLIYQPSGIMLVCGPTGEGKSTTLYSCISELKEFGDIAIMTIEDPIEKYINGVVQCQYHVTEQEKNSFTFGKALRGFMRDDPDVIMVGEIRDKETAVTAIQAAQTGHLILSTLHVKDSISVFNRLNFFDVNSVGFTEQLVGIVSQRLLSICCPKCKRPVVSRYNGIIRDCDRKRLRYGIDANGNEGFISYESVGCDACKGTGILKRIPIVEVLPFDNFLRDYFNTHTNLIDIEKYLREKRDFHSIWEKGMDLVAKGEVSLRELCSAVHVDSDFEKEDKIKD